MSVLFAFGAFIGWGVGDFLIQRCARSGGVTLTVWVISAVGSILLLPTILLSPTPFSALWSAPILITTCAHLANGFFLFWLFKHIKLSIVQPVISLELPLGVLAASLIFHEIIAPEQWTFILIIFGGLLLLSVSANPFKTKRVRLEEGVLLGLLGAVISTTMNLSTGASAEQFDPWFVIWGINVLIALVLLPVVIKKRSSFFLDLRRKPKLFLSMSVIDNAAWLSFSFGVVFLPISIVLGLSQGYVLLSVILGIIFNHERLQWWQYVGVSTTIVGLTALAFTI